MTKSFDTLPTSRPNTPLLDSIDSPADLRKLPKSLMQELSDELRHYLLYCAGQSGGHFGAGLGVVELTVALHFVFNTPNDNLVWDVGHQTYPHKVLTGRREQLPSIRQEGGLSGFPKRSESEYDSFGVGHSSTSISAALGMALAARHRDKSQSNVAIIGDGAMTAGMAFEALFHAAHTRADMLVVLNDNQMSISENHSGLNTYFSKMWASKTYSHLREGGKKVLAKVPPAMEFARKTEGQLKGLVSPGLIFEEIGFNYIGPIDGHDVELLVQTLQNLKDLKGPQFLHIMTQKGKGFTPAEDDPIGYHAISKLEAEPSQPKPKSSPKYQDVFGQWLCDTAAQDNKLVGITPAMREGSGMVAFSKQFPNRYYDVAIAEQHAVTLAAGLACEGEKPVVAIYSTFLQRAYDQLIHDVAIQNLDVTFAIDRAGVVGEDGATHCGSFDLSYMRCIPNLIIAAPSDENECRKLLTTAYQHPGPAAVRYPRGSGTGATTDSALKTVTVGEAVIRRQGEQIAFICFGNVLSEALQAAESINATVVDMRWVKPLDTNCLNTLIESHQLLVTIEENAIAGGAGSAVSEYLQQQSISIDILQLGLDDSFPNHGKPDNLRKTQHLDCNGILTQVNQRCSAKGYAQHIKRA